MEPVSGARIAGEIVGAVAKKIPDLVFKSAGAVWRGYWRLGIFGKVIAAAIAGVAAVVLIGQAPISATARSSLTSAVGGVLILLFFVGIFAGLMRPGRRR